MKIAFINTNSAVPPSFHGSLPIWVYEVSRRLVPHAEVIVYGRKRVFHKEFEMRDGVQYRTVSLRPDLKLNRFIERCFSKLGSPRRPFFASRLFFLPFILRVAHDLRTQQCDIVHIFNFSQFAPIVRFLNPSTKIILLMYCEWLNDLERRTVQRRLNKVDLITGCSEFITAKIRNDFPEFANRCATVFNGVDVDRFHSRNARPSAKNRPKKILFVGRVSPEKGLHLLLEAFKKVIQDYPDAHLEIAGPKAELGPEFFSLSKDAKVSELSSLYSRSQKSDYLSYLQERAVSLGIADRTTFTGPIPYQDVPGRYHDADVLVNPSISESFGMTLTEAMACELPVVVTRVGGMPEVIEDGKTGIVVDSANSSQLAEAILRVLSDEKLAEEFGNAGRKRVLELFSWERIAENLLQHYNDLL